MNNNIMVVFLSQPSPPLMMWTTVHIDASSYLMLFQALEYNTTVQEKNYSMVSTSTLSLRLRPIPDEPCASLYEGEVQKWLLITHPYLQIIRCAARLRKNALNKKRLTLCGATSTNWRRKFRTYAQKNDRSDRADNLHLTVLQIDQWLMTRKDLHRLDHKRGKWR